MNTKFISSELVVFVNLMPTCSLERNLAVFFAANHRKPADLYMRACVDEAADSLIDCGHYEMRALDTKSGCPAVYYAQDDDLEIDDLMNAENESICPSAAAIICVDGGYIAFAGMDDYHTWAAQA